MSIPETIDFDNTGNPIPTGLLGRARTYLREFFLTLVILIVAVLSFGIGRLTGQGSGEAVKIEFDPNLAAVTQAGKPAPLEAGSVGAVSSNGVVASKSGSKYHYPSCPGAEQIKEANKIAFDTARAAEAAGYTLATNCKAP